VEAQRIELWTTSTYCVLQMKDDTTTPHPHWR
jgi:hypothetical protein